MDLDHVFIFTDNPDEVASCLHRFGLTEGTSNVHPGQGTACRRFFFHNAYLELLWVNDEDEAKNSPIARAKLWERSRYQLTNYCPFGLCVRTKNEINKPSTLFFKNAWRYCSAYLPEGQFANIACNEDYPSEPMLFEMPFFGLKPENYPLHKQQPLTHEKGLKEITKVTLTLPTTMKGLSSSIKNLIASNTFAVVEGTNYSVVLEFDHCKEKQNKNLQPLIPLTIRW